MGAYHDDALNLNAHYFGQVNPALTGGKIIGYLYKKDSKFMDPIVIWIAVALCPRESKHIKKSPHFPRIFIDCL